MSQSFSGNHVLVNVMRLELRSRLLKARLVNSFAMGPFATIRVRRLYKPSEAKPSIAVLRVNSFLRTEVSTQMSVNRGPDGVLTRNTSPQRPRRATEPFCSRAEALSV